MRVGLLGGSINPAHSGHLAISELAIKALSLNYVLWAICDRNPQKSFIPWLSLEARLALARRTIVGKKILLGVSGQYAVETLRDARRDNPDYEFIWLMGDDAWVSLHEWHRWQDVRNSVPIVVFRRRYGLYYIRGVPHARRGFRGVGVVPRSGGEWSALRNAVLDESSTDIRSAIMDANENH